MKEGLRALGRIDYKGNLSISRARAYPFLCRRGAARGSVMDIPHYPSQITPRLFLGSFANASYARVFRHLGISAVVNCAAECPCSFDRIRAATIDWWDPLKTSVAGGD